MKKQVIAAAVLCSLLSGAAFAQQSKEGPWMVRARAVSLQSANTDSTGLGLSINDKWIPEVDILYTCMRVHQGATRNIVENRRIKKNC